MSKTWDNFYENKEFSLYYSLLVKQLGQEEADFIWSNRNREREDDNFFNLVKDYKPRDPMCLIGDFSWGYNTIKNDNRLNKPKKLFN